jgi:hypothetical protein
MVEERKMYRVRCNKCGRDWTEIAPSPPTKCTFSTCEDRKKQDLTIEWEKPYELITGKELTKKFIEANGNAE